MKRRGAQPKAKIIAIDQYAQPGPTAALNRQVGPRKRQPPSLARALGDREYVREYRESMQRNKAA